MKEEIKKIIKHLPIADVEMILKNSEKNLTQSNEKELLAYDKHSR